MKRVEREAGVRGLQLTGLAVLLAMLGTCAVAPPPAVDEPPPASQTPPPAGTAGSGAGSIAELVREGPGSGRVLHGAGQSFVNWERYFIPYLRQVGELPVIFSSYISMERIRRRPSDLDQIGTIAAGWSGHRLVPMICLTNQFSRDEVERLKRAVRQGRVPRGDRQQAKQEIVARGFEFKDQQVADGDFDGEIASLARAVAEVDGPVLVRFMQEFVHGIHSRTVAGPESFKAAWRRFADLMRQHGATNAELVFHPNADDPAVLREWWPGDEYVDWVAGTLFSQANFDRCRGEAEWAASRGKAYVIAEAAPALRELKSVGTTDESTWSRWFEPFFDFVRGGDVHAFVYINVDWSRSPRWKGWPDTRVEANDSIEKRYLAELEDDAYVHNEEFWRLYRGGR